MERGVVLERKQAARQILIVLVTYRAEARRGDPEIMRSLRQRSEEILTDLEPVIGDDADLRAMLDDARAEVAAPAVDGLRSG